MVTSDFAVVQPVTKVELNSATIMHGALCVMIPGAHLMQEWFADSLDFHQQVRVHLHMYIYRFMQLDYYSSNTAVFTANIHPIRYLCVYISKSEIIF